MNHGSKLLLIACTSLGLAACQQSETAGGEPANGSATTAGSASASGGSVPGAKSVPNRTIADSLSQSGDHKTVVAALNAAGLAETLKGAGPYTVFAPTEAAFQGLPQGSAAELMKPERKAALTQILTYHVVPGAVTAGDLSAAIRRGDGKAALATMDGRTLTASEVEGAIVITDAKGGRSRVVGADQMQSNGVVHSVDAVLMPE